MEATQRGNHKELKMKMKYSTKTRGYHQSQQKSTPTEEI
jgi:hypothetical protein